MFRGLTPAARAVIFILMACTFIQRRDARVLAWKFGAAIPLTNPRPDYAVCIGMDTGH